MSLNARANKPDPLPRRSTSGRLSLVAASLRGRQLADQQIVARKLQRPLACRRSKRSTMDSIVLSSVMAPPATTTSTNIQCVYVSTAAELLASQRQRQRPRLQHLMSVFIDIPLFQDCCSNARRHMEPTGLAASRLPFRSARRCSLSCVSVFMFACSLIGVIRVGVGCAAA